MFRDKLYFILNDINKHNRKELTLSLFNSKEYILFMAIFNNKNPLYKCKGYFKHELNKNKNRLIGKKILLKLGVIYFLSSLSHLPFFFFNIFYYINCINYSNNKI